MSTTVAIVQALAWPVVVAGGLLAFRRDLAQLLDVVTRKMDRGTVELTAFDVGIKLAEDAARASVSQTGPAPGSPPGETPRQEFTRLVAEYTTLTIADPKLRVAARHRLADRLGVLAVELGLPRGQLAAGSDGERVAMATAAVLEPAEDDLEGLLIAAAVKNFRFTAYRILLATLPVLGRDRLRRKARNDVKAVVDRVEANTEADPALSHMIARLRSLLAAISVR